MVGKKRWRELRGQISRVDCTQTSSSKSLQSTTASPRRPLASIHVRLLLLLPLRAADPSRLALLPCRTMARSTSRASLAIPHSGQLCFVQQRSVGEGRIRGVTGARCRRALPTVAEVVRRAEDQIRSLWPSVRSHSANPRSRSVFFDPDEHPLDSSASSSRSVSRLPSPPTLTGTTSDHHRNSDVRSARSEG